MLVYNQKRQFTIPLKFATGSFNSDDTGNSLLKKGQIQEYAEAKAFLAQGPADVAKPLRGLKQPALAGFAMPARGFNPRATEN
jgi:hypothetical protein